MNVYKSPSGRSLSREQFIGYFEKKVRKTIRTNKLIGKKEKVLVASSGGKDSTTALYLLDKIVTNRNVTIEAIHVDADIGDYSKINKRNIKKFCKEVDIKLHETSFREEFGYSLCYIKGLLKDKGVNWKSCNICGILRRYLLNKKAKELKATKLVTGHNLDDEAQSIIMNVFTNNIPVLARLGPMTGLKRFKGFVPRIKPLYFCSEEEVRIYSKLHDFPVKYDKCPCRSEAYRKEVADMLNDFEQKHRQTKFAIVRGFLEMLPALKKNYVSGSVSVCKKCGEPAAKGVCNACRIIEGINV